MCIRTNFEDEDEGENLSSKTYNTRTFIKRRIFFSQSCDYNTFSIYIQRMLWESNKILLSQTDWRLWMDNCICCQLNNRFNWKNTVSLFLSCEIIHSIRHSVQSTIFSVFDVTVNLVDLINSFFQWIGNFPKRSSLTSCAAVPKRKFTSRLPMSFNGNWIGVALAIYSILCLIESNYHCYYILLFTDFISDCILFLILFVCQLYCALVAFWWAYCVCFAFSKCLNSNLSWNCIMIS